MQRVHYIKVSKDDEVEIYFDVLDYGSVKREEDFDGVYYKIIRRPMLKFNAAYLDGVEYKTTRLQRYAASEELIEYIINEELVEGLHEEWQ